MLKIAQFTFNPFQENTFILFNEKGACFVVDPGCYNTTEEQVLVDFIEEEGLKPEGILLTHAHLDHVLGNAFLSKKYGLDIWMHPEDQVTLQYAEQASQLYGIPYNSSPEPQHKLEHGQVIRLGEEELEVVFVPGHAPGHVAFISHQEKWVINGDVLFQMSIGRTDLPGGDFPTLERSIREQLYTLPDDYTVYAGHGPEASIGFEKQHGYIRPV